MKKSKRGDIVEVSARHFSRYGYEASSMESIASEVGISKAAIYYHFKDKAALYEEVLNGRLDSLLESIEDTIPHDGGCDEKLVRYIETFGEYLSKNRCFAAMLAHEFADNGSNMPDSSAKRLSHMLGMITGLLNDGMEEGIFEAQNPMLIQMMIVSVLIMHQTTDDLRKRVAAEVKDGYTVPPDPDVEDVAVKLAEKILKLLKSG
jgi:AcrR family transcriptional regulator